MDSKFIKSHQCSLERSDVALTKIILNYDQNQPFFDKKNFLQVCESQKITKTEQ